MEGGESEDSKGNITRLTCMQKSKPTEDDKHLRIYLRHKI